MTRFIKTWRWFGPDDPVKLHWLKEIGVDEVVTALHHIPNGKVWPFEEIEKRKKTIESAGLKWTVVESLPVTEEIKAGTEQREIHIENYKASLKNLAKSGIKTVVYNFMPVIDWIRTDLNFKLPNGGESMLFDFPTFAAFDMFILKRPGAENDYPDTIRKNANKKFRQMTGEEAEILAHNIIVVTQKFIDGTVDPTISGYKQEFLRHLKRYGNSSDEHLRQNLAHFLNQIIPVAEKVNINLAIHPDDPPFPVLGLPRIFNTIDDMVWLQKENPSSNNGIAFCVGSFSSRKDNNLIEMAQKFGHRFHFVHLRNTQVTDDGSFFEAGHIEGGVNMSQLIKVLVTEMQKRKNSGRADFRIPMRPDHGIKLMNDFNLKSNPGYSLIGRLKGLSEIVGIEEVAAKFNTLL